MNSDEKPSFLTQQLSAADSASVLSAFCEGFPEKCGDALTLMKALKAEKRTPIMLFKLRNYMQEKTIYSLEYLANNWSKYSRSFGSWSRHSGFSTYGRYDEKTIKHVLDLLNVEEIA